MIFLYTADLYQNTILAEKMKMLKRWNYSSNCLGKDIIITHVAQSRPMHFLYFLFVDFFTFHILSKCVAVLHDNQ